MAGKGSKRRPTNEAAFASGWERIYGKQEQSKDEEQGAREADGRQASVSGNEHVDPAQAAGREV